MNQIQLSCNEPQGKLTGYIFRYILDEQRKIEQSWIWTCDLRIDVPALYPTELSSPILELDLIKIVIKKRGLFSLQLHLVRRITWYSLNIVFELLQDK